MSRQQRTRGPSPRGRKGSEPPPIAATPTSRRLPAPRIPRGRRIEAPRREPVRTAGRWARDAPGSPSNRPPPTRPIRDHDHEASENQETLLRLGASPCHLAAQSALAARRGRTGTCSSPGDFATGGSLGRMGAACESQRFPGSCACPLSRPLPARTYRPRTDAIEAPRREPAGRRAVGREMPPEARATAHHQPAESAITNTKPPKTKKLFCGSGRARAISPDARCRHPALRSLDAGSLSASLPSLRQQRRLDWHGLTPREPGFRAGDA